MNMFGHVSMLKPGPELFGPTPRRMNCASGHVLRSVSRIAMVLHAAAGSLSAARLCRLGPRPFDLTPASSLRGHELLG